MDEDKKPQEGTEEFQGTDVTEETVATKPVFVVNLFQTARVHTERIDNGFTSKEEAEDYAREICKDKGIDPDFEIEEVAVEVPAVENESQVESQNSPEGSGEKTPQENVVPLN